ncbi:hypothetical protein ACFODZ_13375 [Marinicella sediminis]|uniref:Uncharacterized protein n=1 Tax=Marinicella sediminis TaxID=1792834 RepID=A0ABV7JEM0_9GAMM|nr:hypothetical protein [Marinicella sediminis]
MFTNSEDIRIDLVEVADASPMAGTLFKRSFHAEIPDFPKHFVLLAADPTGRLLTLGYVHFTKEQNMYLGGGMCVNLRGLKQLPKPWRDQLNIQGGVAFTMLSEAVKQLNDCDAVFGYVGHKGAYKIDLAVGFEQTQYQHLIVYWKKPLDQQQQHNIIQQAHQFGPF